ncbi:MAG: hypothetical protein WBC01_02240 [Solirubrobacterales bacterium]
MRVGRVLAGIICAGLSALLIAPAQASARPPAEFYGVVTQFGSLSEAEAARMRRGGVGTVRFLIPWQGVERLAGSYDWQFVDDQIEAIESAGAVPLPVLYGLPQWLGEPRTPPLGSPDAELGWQSFLGEAVDRYGPGGELATADPEYVPLRSWQIWNEPNLPSFWGNSTPSASGYMRLLRLSALAIRERDPGAELIAAGLSPASNGVPPPKYLKRLYDRYAKLGLEPDFNQISLNPYAGSVRESRLQVAKFSRTAKAATGRRPPLLIAEVGWGSSGPKRHPVSGTQAEQARRLKTAYRMFARKRRDWRIKAVLWYAWRDVPADIDACIFCSFVGLFDADGRAKPAWKVFRRVAR